MYGKNQTRNFGEDRSKFYKRIKEGKTLRKTSTALEGWSQERCCRSLLGYGLVFTSTISR